MKLISRKALTATIAAAAISTASLTAPAMAQTETTAPTSTAAATTTEKAPATTTEAPAPAGSSDSLFIKDGKEMDTLEKIKVVVGILSAIATVFTTLISISKNFDQIIKQFNK